MINAQPDRIYESSNQLKKRYIVRLYHIQCNPSVYDSTIKPNYIIHEEWLSGFPRVLLVIVPPNPSVPCGLVKGFRNNSLTKLQGPSRNPLGGQAG